MNANELVTELRYRVDRSGMRDYLSKLRNGAAVAKGVTQGIALGVRDQAKEWRRAIAAQREQIRASREQKAANGQMFDDWKNRLTQILGLLGAAKASQMADAWSGVRSRVSLEIDKTEVQKTLDQLFNTAQNTQQAYTAVADMYLPIVRNRKELELTNEDSLRLTETISKLIAIGGGEAGANAAALTQLGQALGSGVLRGDELNSIMEQAPKLAQGIAEAMGVTVGQLRDMGKEGKITAKALSQGLLKQADKIDGEFSQMAATFSGGTQVILNGIERQIDRWNRLTGAAEKFSKLARVIGDNIGHAMNISLLAAAVLAFGKLRAILLTMNFALLRMVAVVAGLYLVLDDIAGWAQGKDSLLGSLIGDASEWQGFIDTIKGFFGWMQKATGDASGSVGAFVTRWGAVGLALMGVWKILSSVFAVVVPIVKVMFSILRVLWVVGKVAAAIAAGLITWPAAIAAAIIAATVLIYNYWDEITAFISSAWQTVTNALVDGWSAGLDRMRAGWQSFVQWVTNLAPEWLRNGASWVGEKIGITSGEAAAPRSGGASGPVTVSNEITVNAPSSDPAAVAAAAGNAVATTARSAYAGTGRRGLPSVEAAQ